VPPTEHHDLVGLATQAYVYGFPLVYSLGESAAFVAGSTRFPCQAPYNSFGHARELAGPEFKFVTPNNDTVYSIAVCDVGEGPLVLHVPDTAGRYYVLQLVDAWTNNFAYIGRRATGTAEAQYLLVGPGDTARAPDGMQVVQVPSNVFTIVGRNQVDGVADLPTVHALQDSFTLTPLSVVQGGSEPGPAPGIPTPDPAVDEQLAWWEQLRLYLAAYPPPPGDQDLVEQLAKLGLTAAESPFVDPDPELAAALTAGAKAGAATIDSLMQSVHADPNGWQVTTHLFDYNRDYLGLGTIDAPQWKIADRKTAYATRAAAARAGLWGNHGYEATYALIWVDGDGEPLDGAHRYELHLEPPPVDAFWSFTMYAPPDFYLVANSIDRYAIGDRTPGLVTAADGRVTISLQQDSPGEDKESNWLPTPAGAFRPVLRLYQPRQPVLDGTYELPPIRRVG
jgi:hypothetical protein